VDILLEKPIAATLAEADELIALADAKGLILQIGFVERFNPAIVALHAVMGHPLFIESHRLHPFFERGTDVDVILDLMVHDLDILLHFVVHPVNRSMPWGTSSRTRWTSPRSMRLQRLRPEHHRKPGHGRPCRRHASSVEGYKAWTTRNETCLLGGKATHGQVTIMENPVEIKEQDPLMRRSAPSFRPWPTNGPRGSGRKAATPGMALRINAAIDQNDRVPRWTPHGFLYPPSSRQRVP
jgi:hypothetical protein